MSFYTTSGTVQRGHDQSKFSICVLGQFKNMYENASSSRHWNGGKSTRRPNQTCRAVIARMTVMTVIWRQLLSDWESDMNELVDVHMFLVFMYICFWCMCI